VPQPELPLVRLSELTPGQFAEFFALLRRKKLATTQDGKRYFACEFGDLRRKVPFRCWAETTWYEACEHQWQEGQCYRIRAVYTEHEKYGPSLDIHAIRLVNDADLAEGFRLADFIERSRQDPEVMFAELYRLAETEITDQPLQRLVTTLLNRHAEPLKRLPATSYKFHPFPGGLLEHTLSVTQTCLFLVDRYAAYYSELQPPLNRGLVIAGAILHDLGRVLEFDDASPAQPTVQGHLHGHLVLGRDLVRDAARELGDVNPELLQLLEHLILTHLALPAWGSPRLPRIPECLILHHADDLDAKLEMYVRCLTRDQAPGAFTYKDPILNRELYKRRSV
jgi:3'-5' exoribonuclease